MFSQNVKKVISITMIVAMTICSNGFSVLATSVESVVSDTQTENQDKETKNYYLEYQEYHEEKVVISKNAVVEEDASQIVDSKNQESEENELTSNGEETSLVFDVEDEEELEESEYAEEPEADEVEEPEYDIVEDKEDDEANTEIVDENAESSQLDDENIIETDNNIEETDTDISEVNDEEITTVEETEEAAETTEKESTEEEIIEEETDIEESNEETDIVATDSLIEISDEETDNINDIKEAETDIDFSDATNSELDKDVKIIKKYIYATRSIPEDSKWTLKEILAADANASFREIPRLETIKEKYLAKNIKVLLENQYGDQKVVEVPANWNVSIISKVYKPEGYVAEEKKYEADADGNVVVTDKEGNVEVKTLDENGNLVSTDSDIIKKDNENEDETKTADTTATTTIEEIKSETIDVAIEGFAGSEEATENEEVNAEEEVADDAKIETTDKTTDEAISETIISDDEYDVNIDDVIVEYEEITDNTPIVPNDDELKKTNALIGNANNNMLTAEKAEEEGVAELDIEKLLSDVAHLLGSEVNAVDAVPYSIPIFGLTGHDHWVCGRANCSDTLRNHFNENMNTLHPEAGVVGYQAVDNFADFKSYVESNATDKDYIYLTADIQVTEMVKLTRPLFLCLNDYTLSFAANGQICTYYDMDNPTVETLGNYSYGICVCGCNTSNATNDDENGANCGRIDGLGEERVAPAFFYTKSKGVYFYGLGNNGVVDNNYNADDTRILITNFKNYADDTIPTWDGRKGQAYENASGEKIYSYPQNKLYNTAEDRYDDKNSAFLTMSINSPDEAAEQTTRQAFFYAVDIENIQSNDGGFANLYYISSFAMEHCKIASVSAFRGGIVSVVGVLITVVGITLQFPFSKV